MYYHILLITFKLQFEKFNVNFAKFDLNFEKLK